MHFIIILLTLAHCLLNTVNAATFIVSLKENTNKNIIIKDIEKQGNFTVLNNKGGTVQRPLFETLPMIIVDMPENLVQSLEAHVDVLAIEEDSTVSVDDYSSSFDASEDGDIADELRL